MGGVKVELLSELTVFECLPEIAAGEDYQVAFYHHIIVMEHLGKANVLAEFFYIFSPRLRYLDVSVDVEVNYDDLPQ